MLVEELLELADTVCRLKAETQTVEVKSAREGCPRRLYDTLSSFSNQDSGGTLLFGIDETAGFVPVGVYDLQDLQKRVTEQCNQMEPPVRAVFTVAEYEGKPICAAEIPALDLAERPCYYRGHGKVKGSFVRVGDGDLPMTDYELYRYEAFRRHLHDDERPVERATLTVFEQDKLQTYLAKRRAARPGLAQLPLEQQYEMLSVTRDGIPTLSAVLNFCMYPQGYFPELGITAIVVPGTEIGAVAEDSARFLDNKRIEGPIATMVEEALAFCSRNMKVRTIIAPNTGMRTDRTEYPINAIREAVLNALIHRDYSFYTEGTPVQIAFFTDRLEIHSPGSLYGRTTVEQLGHSRPDVRNPALAVMTEILTDAEHRYSGIPTIRREMEAYGLPEPVFENRRNEFVVILYNQPNSGTAAGQTAGEAKDLLAFCQTPRTRREIADYLGISTAYYAMQHYVLPLVAEGKLALTLPDRPSSRNQRYYTAQ